MIRVSANTDAAIALNYTDLYGKPVDMTFIKEILKRFAVDDWLCQLARLTSVLGGPRNRDRKWIEVFVKYFAPPEELSRVSDWFKKHEELGRTTVAPSERHLEILMELVIRYAPETAENKMAFPGDEGSIFDALLAVAALDVGAKDGALSEDRDSALAVFSSLLLRSICPNPLEIAIRGYDLYEILKGLDRSPKAVEWANLFEKATGENIDDYFAGGFGTLIHVLDQNIEDLKSGWDPVLAPDHLSKYPRLQRLLPSYYRLRSGRITDIKQEIERLEPDDDLENFNLIPLRKYPLVRLNNSIYPLSLSSMANSLLDGIYYAVITAAIEDRIPEKVQDIGSVFGYLYENMVIDLLEAKFVGRVLRSPVREDTGEEAADALVLCPGGLVVFQIKGSHTKVKGKVASENFAVEEGKFFEQTGMNKAIDQLVTTVDCCRAGRIRELPDFWQRPDVLLQPVIVTYERIPQFSLMQSSLNRRLMEPVQVDANVRQPILMSTDDIEHVVSLPLVDDLWRVLAEYVQTGISSFANFLAAKRYPDMTIMGDRRNHMLDSILKHLGLEDVS